MGITVSQLYTNYSQEPLVHCHGSSRANLINFISKSQETARQAPRMGFANDVAYV